MQFERSLRIAPRDFQEYFVQVTIGDRIFDASLGNISETGLCILLVGTVDFNSENGNQAEGTIRSKLLPESLNFTGRTVWTSLSKVNDHTMTLVGINFNNQINLPDTLIALGMSAGDIV